MRKVHPRHKKYMLKVKIFGVNIYVCNLNLKPYLRPFDNRNASTRNKSRRMFYERGRGNLRTLRQEDSIQRDATSPRCARQHERQQ